MKNSNSQSQNEMVEYSKQSLILKDIREKRLMKSLAEFRAIQLYVYFFQEGLQGITFNRQPIPTIIV